MYVQCVACTKKYKIKAESIPHQGAVVTCKGCGAKLRIGPRENLEGDHTKIPVTKRKHQKEVKWYGRTEESIKQMGYEKKTAEYNTLFYFQREIRKRFGITFFDIDIKARLKTVDRELMYNRLSFMGPCCVPPTDNAFESCISGLLGAMAAVLRGKDSAGRFTEDEVLRVAYKDSFPVLYRFGYGASFEASYGEVLYGNAVQVDISLDRIRELPDDYDGTDLHKVARVELSRVPIETGSMTLRELSTPGLHVNAEPDPDLRCTDKNVAKIIKRFS